MHGHAHAHNHNDHNPSCSTMIPDAIKSLVSFGANGYWIAGTVDAIADFAATEAVALGLSWYGIVPGIVVAAITAFCEYRVHATQDGQNEVGGVRHQVSEEEMAQVKLPLKKHAYLAGSFASDTLGLAGDIMMFFSIAFPNASRAGKLGALAATCVAGLYANRPEYWTHVESQRKDQVLTERALASQQPEVAGTAAPSRWRFFSKIGSWCSGNKSQMIDQDSSYVNLNPVQP
ncbi:MAG: hypothetical protein ABI597_04675 [Gammaproteobacteria bacterium]